MKKLLLTTAAVVTLALPALAYSADATTPNDPGVYSPSDNMNNNDTMDNSGAMNNDYGDNNHSSAGGTTSGPPSKTSGSMDNTTGKRYVTRSEFLSQGHTRQEFTCLDKNRDGRLSQAELSAGQDCYNNQ